MTNGEWWTDSDTLSTLSGLSARAGQVEIRMMRGKRSPNCEKSQSQQPRALKDSEMVEAAQRDGGIVSPRVTCNIFSGPSLFTGRISCTT